MTKFSSTFWVWLVVWPVLLPIYAVVIIFYPIAWVVRVMWRASTRWT